MPPLRRRRRRRLRAVMVAVVVVVMAIGVTIILLPTTPRPVSSTCTVASGLGSGPYVLTPDQAQNATIIAAVGIKLGLADHAVTVALATSMQESRIENLHYGDQDSLGLFQQRPSQGWGTPAQILDPVYAATQFYDHLAQVPGWDSMPVTQAAQAVQRSADPNAYAQWEPEARALAVATTGERAAGLACQLNGFRGAQPSSAALASAAAAQLGPNAFGKPATTQVGWQVAAWAVAHAHNYHLTSVSYDGRQWAWNSVSTTWASAPVTTSVTFTRQ